MDTYMIYRKKKTNKKNEIKILTKIIEISVRYGEYSNCLNSRIHLRTARSNSSWTERRCSGKTPRTV